MRPNLGRREGIQRSLVAFVVGQVRYAIDITEVREIVTPLPLTSLPHTPEGLAGVADHRDQVVPVIDLRVRFGLPDRAGTNRKVKWILVGMEGRTVGLIVDDVLGVLRVPAGDFRAAPDLGGGEKQRGIASVTTHDRSLVFVLELTQLESAARLDQAAILMAAHAVEAEES